MQTQILSLEIENEISPMEAGTYSLDCCSTYIVIGVFASTGETPCNNGRQSQTLGAS